MHTEHRDPEKPILASALEPVDPSGGNDLNLSVAGEEDPGASLDTAGLPADVPAPGTGAGTTAGAPPAPDGATIACGGARPRSPAGCQGAGAGMVRNASITGKVEYREGDGPNITIRPGPCKIEETALDATISWTDGETHGSAAIPIDDYRRHVAAKAIRVDGPRAP